jgi:hypothetical protein
VYKALLSGIFLTFLRVRQKDPFPMQNILTSCKIPQILILTPLFWFPNSQFVDEIVPKIVLKVLFPRHLDKPMVINMSI